MSKRCECESPAMKDCRKQIQPKQVRKADRWIWALPTLRTRCDAVLSAEVSALLISAWICSVGIWEGRGGGDGSLDVRDSWGTVVIVAPKIRILCQLRVVEMRGRGILLPPVLIGVSVADFLAKGDNRKKYSWAKTYKCYWFKITHIFFNIKWTTLNWTV